jgi:hypothetical protein
MSSILLARRVQEHMRWMGGGGRREISVSILVCIKRNGKRDMEGEEIDIHVAAAKKDVEDIASCSA